MATLAARPARAPTDRAFFTGMALALLATTFAGFAPTYYMLPYFEAVTARGVAGGASLTPLVHMHGILFSAWMLLYVAQTWLVAAGRVGVHRKLGVAGAVVAPLLVAVGLLTAIQAARLGSSPPGWDDKAFLLVPFMSMAVFAGFFAAGVVRRKRADYHKRFMLLATMAMLVPALARIMRMTEPPFLPIGVYGGLVVLNLFLAALVIFDIRRTGRIHPATIWGIGIYLTTWPARLLLGSTEPWQAFAQTVIG
jgi:hypothetical protein